MIKMTRIRIQIQESNNQILKSYNKIMTTHNQIKTKNIIQMNQKYMKINKIRIQKIKRHKKKEINTKKRKWKARIDEI